MISHIRFHLLKPIERLHAIHLHKCFLLMISDNNVDPLELGFIKTLTTSYGVKKWQLDYLNNNVKKATFTPNDFQILGSYYLRKYILDYITISKLDGKIANTERSRIEGYLQELGVPPIEIVRLTNSI